MADYHTRFSCVLDLGSHDQVEEALALYDQMEEILEREDEAAIGFLASPYSASGKLWISDDAGCGDPEHVIAFVIRCAVAFDLQGRWGFVWALTCSRPRLDGFGGGAQVIDLSARKSVGWMDCDHWLAEQLAEGGRPAAPGDKT